MSSRRRSRPDATIRIARAVFLSGMAIIAVSLAGFDTLLRIGLDRPLAAAGAGAAALLVAAVCAWASHRRELAERRAKVLRAQEETARERAKGAGGSRPSPAAEPASADARLTPPNPLPPRNAPPSPRDQRESLAIQAALLPKGTPSVPGYHIEVDYRPCGLLGGDFYDFRELPDGRLLVTLGDVSGKGNASAIVMAMIQTLFREHGPHASGPADLLARVNDGFRGALGKGVFATALAAVLDPAAHSLTLAGAGHHPLLLLNARERRSTLVSARGLALGLVGGDRFQEALVETRVYLEAGDTLLLYTDGATDCAQELSTGVGQSRFLAAAAAAVLPGPGGALERLATDLWEGGGRRDDTTMLLIARLSEAAPDRMQSPAVPADLKA